MPIRYKVVTVIGTRAELVKLSRIIPAFDEAFEHVLVHTGQHYDYELNQIFFDELNIRQPDHILNCSAGKVFETIGLVISSVGEILEKESPDVVFIYGDTNSGLSAIAAKKLNIPTFHMEAGNRCFDEAVPEEHNRRVIDHTSDILLSLTNVAKQNLLREGIQPDKILCTGSPMFEVYQFYKTQIDGSNVLSDLNIKEGEYFLIGLHRHENVNNHVNLKSFVDSVHEILSYYKDKKLIIPAHPYLNKQLSKFAMENIDERVLFVKPLGFFDYTYLQKNAFCVLNDGGTLIEEAAMLGLKAVMLRDTHERIEGIEAGALVVSKLKAKNILRAIQLVCHGHKVSSIPASYTNARVSQNVVKLIASYAG